MAPFVAYNLIAAVLCAATLFRMWQRPETPPHLAAVVVASLLALVAFALPLPGFFALALAGSWSAFVHLPIALGVGAIVIRRAWPKTAVAFAAVAAVAAFTGVWGFFVEPYRLQVKRVRIESPEVTEPITIALVADFQTDHMGPYQERALALVREAAPDLVLFAGDYVQGDDAVHAAVDGPFNGLVRTLEPRLGGYAVQGNVERTGWERLFDGTRITASSKTTTYDLGEVSVTALSFVDGFTPGRSPDAGGFHVVLAHGPDFALGDVDADLLVAGHTHGGQVQIPGYGPAITFSAVPRDWADDTTELDGGRTLIVSRGVGLERGYAPRVRLFCPPQLVFVDVVPAAGAAAKRAALPKP